MGNEDKITQLEERIAHLEASLKWLCEGEVERIKEIFVDALSNYEEEDIKSK